MPGYVGRTHGSQCIYGVGSPASQCVCMLELYAAELLPILPLPMARSMGMGVCTPLCCLTPTLLITEHPWYRIVPNV